MDKGKLKNEKTRLPRRHSHRHTCLSSHLGSPRAVPAAPTVLGCCYSRWLFSPQSAAATARPAQPRQAWQEQRHPSLCSLHAAPERLLHPQNQLSFHPWALAIHFTKSGGQKDRAESLLLGWRRWKEIAVLRDAPLGRGDEPRSRAEVPLSHRTPPQLPTQPGPQ